MSAYKQNDNEMVNTNNNVNNISNKGSNDVSET